MAKNRNLKNVLDSLIDEDGIRTEVNVTITMTTLINVVGGMLVAGGGIVLIAHMAKRFFPNKQLSEVNQHLIQLKRV